ncbi:MAG: GtrA family protein [Chitinispirillales bacterium]|jgi:putative flippase GtrA|nr:GtrA family protein [Chitinispirillales bacterium]
MILEDKHIRGNLLQFFKFGLVGLSNTAVVYFVYSALVYLGVYYIAASVASFAVGILNSFLWNHKYVFKDDTGERSITRSLIKTYAVYAFTGLIVQNILLYVYVDILKMLEYAALLFVLPITVPLNYILNKRWVFKAVRRN